MDKREELLAKLKDLEPKIEHGQISEEQACEIEKHLDEVLKMLPPFAPQWRLLELRGLGKEFWQGIDVDAYLKEERASWR